MLSDKIEATISAKGADLIANLTQKLTKEIIKLPVDLQGLGWAALDTVYQRRETIAKTTASALVAGVAHIALGQQDQARIEWIGSLSDVDELFAELDMASAEAQKAAKDRSDAFDAFEMFAKEFLKAGLQVAVPLLLAVV